MARRAVHGRGARARRRAPHEAGGVGRAAEALEQRSADCAPPGPDRVTARLGASARARWHRCRARAGPAADARAALLSPHRSQRRPAGTHDRRIVTDAPNLMGATDATRSPPCRDGKACVLSPSPPALATPKLSAGTLSQAPGAPRGAAGRQHGGGPSRRRRRAQVSRCATTTAAPSWPRTSRTRSRPGGAAELLLRRAAGDKRRHRALLPASRRLRDAARDFVLRYNTQWLIEKNGHLSSADARQRWLDQNLPRAA